MPCVVCSKNVSPSKTILCSECKLNFHPSCTKFGNISNFNKLGTGKNVWTCDTCSSSNNFTVRKKIDVTNNDIESATGSSIADLSNIHSSIKSILIKLKKLDLLTNSFNEIQESMTFCSDKIDDFSNKLDRLVNTVNDNSKQIAVIEHKCLKMQEEIDLLKRNHNLNEQSKLMNNLEICGIPITTNESLSDILSKLANLVNVEFTVEDINKIYRTKGRNETNRNIIVTFNNINKKIELIKAFKNQYKVKPITATELSSNFTNLRIYLNDQLSTDNKKFLWITKQLAMKYHFKFVWSNSSGVYLKKKEGDMGVRVYTLSQLMAMDINKTVECLWK